MQRLTLALAATAVVATPAQAAPYLSDYEIGVVRTINSAGSPVLDAPMGMLSHTGFVIAAPLAMAVASNPGSVAAPLLVLASEGLAYGAQAAIKPLFKWPRPYATYPDLKTPNGKMEDDPYSFPSGHAAVSFAAATALADQNPGLALPAYGLAALISYSRMYNGLHYPSDLLAGALVGIGVGKATRWGFDQLNGRYGLPSLGMQPTASFGDGYVLGVSRQF